MKDFGSIITSMVTPFDKHLELDGDRLTDLVEHLINTGTESVVIGDVVGDTDTISFEEKVLMLEHVKNQTNGRLGVIAAINFSAETDKYEHIKHLNELKLTDALLISFSNTSSLTQEEMINFVTQASEEINIPIFLDNSDGERYKKYDLDSIIRLSSLKNVIGIKEGSRNMCALTKIINSTPQSFHLYCADDRFLLPTLAIGGKGVISLASHIFGRKLREMVAYYKRGRVDRCLLIHHDYSSFFEDIYSDYSASRIKNALCATGINVGEVRDLNESIQREHALFSKLVVAESI